MRRVPADLVWEQDLPEKFSAELTGHFWAQIAREAEGRWRLTIWDYQNNEMLSGYAESLDGAKAAIVGWDAWVVSSDVDPSRE